MRFYPISGLIILQGVREDLSPPPLVGEGASLGGRLLFLVLGRAVRLN